MDREVLFDLNINKQLEGNYFSCNAKLVDSVFALMENGYKVVDCQLKDDNYIYLKNSDVTVNVSTSESETVDRIITEGKEKGEYRRITYRDSKVVKYDSFTPSNMIEIRILGDHDFGDLPLGYRVLNIGDVTIIRIPIKEVVIDDNMYGYPRSLTKLDIFSTVGELESWIQSITGKEITHKELPSNEYGNSEFAIDYNNGQFVDANYVSLDPLMIPVISQLRDKGYQTIGCCSGHYDGIFIQNTSLYPEENFINKYVESWIVFSNEGDVPTPPEDANVSSVSKFYRISYKVDLLDCNVLYKPANVVKEEIEKSMNKLLEWAKTLPNAKKVSIGL